MPKELIDDGRNTYEVRESLRHRAQKLDDDDLARAVRNNWDLLEVLIAYEDLFTEIGHSEVRDITEAARILHDLRAGYIVTQDDVDAYTRIKDTIARTRTLEITSDVRTFLGSLSIIVWSNPECENTVHRLIAERGLFDVVLLEEITDGTSPLTNGVL